MKINILIQKKLKLENYLKNHHLYILIPVELSHLQCTYFMEFLIVELK